MEEQKEIKQKDSKDYIIRYCRKHINYPIKIYDEDNSFKVNDHVFECLYILEDIDYDYTNQLFSPYPIAAQLYVLYYCETLDIYMYIISEVNPHKPVTYKKIYKGYISKSRDVFFYKNREQVVKTNESVSGLRCDFQRELDKYDRRKIKTNNNKVVLSIKIPCSIKKNVKPINIDKKKYWSKLSIEFTGIDESERYGGFCLTHERTNIEVLNIKLRSLNIAVENIDTDIFRIEGGINGRDFSLDVDKLFYMPGFDAKSHSMKEIRVKDRFHLKELIEKDFAEYINTED